MALSMGIIPEQTKGYSLSIIGCKGLAGRVNELPLFRLYVMVSVPAILLLLFQLHHLFQHIFRREASYW